MRKLLIAALALGVLYGCSSDETVYHPHFTQADVQAAQKADSEAASNSKNAPAPVSEVVQKVGGLDVAKYGIPLYPQAKLDDAANKAYLSSNAEGKDIQIALDSPDSPELITQWYKDQLRAEKAYIMKDATLGSTSTIKGRTHTDYPVSVNVVRIDTTTSIDITVTEITKK